MDLSLIQGLYENLAEVGFGYGPTFQGLRAAWRRGDELFAEVALPEGTDAAGFGVHPALLDSALHTMGLAAGEGEGTAGEARLPFAWSGVSVSAVGATLLRVRITSVGSGVSLVLADSTGAPVASVESLALRAISPDQLTAAADTGTRDALFQVDWISHEVAEERVEARWAALGDSIGVPGLRYADLAAFTAAADSGESVPGVVAVSFAEPGSAPGDVVSSTHEVAARALGLVQGWLADERFADARLVVVTSGAVACDGQEAPDPVQAAVWGLV
ncbi:polyketide synthase dehydratase domain-containing protein, partial [Streptomyces sp. NRRL S-15]|uniref:polyketide synthase dehydratase domain-containing protein n=1 Tax=Streptomyces sp. NRRL S-15 TaxID=1463886 RepID=UPI0005B503A1